jgi:hypothetical protein
VPDADLVIDIAVRDRHVGEDEIGEVEPFEHFLDDERAWVLIGPHSLIAERLYRGDIGVVPQRVEVDFGRALAGRGLRRPAAVRHDHEAERFDHIATAFADGPSRFGGLQ